MVNEKEEGTRNGRQEEENAGWLREEAKEGVSRGICGYLCSIGSELGVNSAVSTSGGLGRSARECLQGRCKACEVFEGAGQKQGCQREMRRRRIGLARHKPFLVLDHVQSF